MKCQRKQTNESTIADNCHNSVVMHEEVDRSTVVILVKITVAIKIASYEKL